MKDKTLPLALARISFFKPRERLLLLDLLDNSSALLDLKIQDLEGMIQRRIKKGSWNPLKALEEGEKDFENCRKYDIQILYFWDSDYPPQLREIYDPPILLFYRGNPPDCSKPLVSVVGTRIPNGIGAQEAYRIAFDLSSQGIGIVSGLARGVDGKAHRGALDGGSPTYAVLGCGVERFYPASNRTLAREILQKGGAVMSEYPPLTPPLQYHFPQRNRIISGLGRCLVVVQAPEHSGALITADYALDQGREVFVSARSLSGREGLGTRRLSEDGAKALQEAGEILADWQFPFREKRAALPKQVLEPGKTLAALMEEELSGRLIKFNGEYFRRT